MHVSTEDYSFYFWVNDIYVTICIFFQFHLQVGIIGACYLAATITYVIGSILAGPLTDKLVSILYTQYRIEPSHEGFNPL